MRTNADIIRTYLKDALWQNSGLCQSILQLSETVDIFTVVHGDAIYRVADTTVLSLDPKQGNGRNPKSAIEKLFELLSSRYDQKWLSRVFLISDERNIEAKFYRCPDGFYHASRQMPPNLEDFRKYVLDGIEYIDILAIFEKKQQQCDFAKPIASIVSAFDEEGFILVESANCR